MYVQTVWIRAYLGDMLVVILLYAVFQSLFIIIPWKAILLVLLFSFSVEFAQYFGVIHFLNLQHHAWARIVIGTHFSVIDLVMYVLGGLGCFGLELILRKKTIDYI